MNIELWNLNLEQLNALYQEEEEKLLQSLLAGRTWKEVIEQRRTVGELYTLIFKKTNQAHFNNPAEHTLLNK